MENFSEKFKKVIIPKVQKEIGLDNVMAAPRLEKIVVNVGIGTRMKNSKDYSDIVSNIASITGQRPIVTKAKQAISNFKLREDMPNGIVTTLRKEKMMSFLNRMINVAFPRIRDFQGFAEKGFDGNGNYSVGIKDCSIFPEINPDDLSHIHGLSISIITTTNEDQQAKTLLKALNFPFKKIPKPASSKDERKEGQAEVKKEEILKEEPIQQSKS